MKPPKVVITSRVHKDVLDLLGTTCRVVANEQDEPWSAAALLALTRDADGLLVSMTDLIDQAFITQCERLRVIGSVLKGYDNLDIDACTARGIWVSIVSDQLTAATAELTIGLMIGLSRHLVCGDAAVRRGHRGWRPVLYGKGIENSTVGLLGLGAIGQAIARRLKPFGCTVHYFDERSIPNQIADHLGVRPVSLDEALTTSDFVVIALPLTSRTRHLIDAKRLEKIKKGCYLVNAARGSIVDEEAVADALNAGRLAGYAADVFEMEDMALENRPVSIPDRLLADRSRTLLTPHIGSADVRARRLAELEMAHSILDYFAGRTPRGAINRPGKKALAS